MSFARTQQLYKGWTITVDSDPLNAPPYRVTIRRPGALAEEPGVIEDDEYAQALARARELIDKPGAVAQGAR